MPENRHVYREHVTEGLDCWCNPTFQLPCDECEDGCWKCEGGIIWLTRSEAEYAPRPIVIIHRSPADAYGGVSLFGEITGEGAES